MAWNGAPAPALEARQTLGERVQARKSGKRVPTTNPEVIPPTHLRRLGRTGAGFFLTFSDGRDLG